MDNHFWRNQNRSYVFDVDGTLSHARQPMDKEFHDWFVNWMATRDVYLVTGSDRPKTVEQIGEDIVDGCNMSFQCAGNDVCRGCCHDEVVCVMTLCVCMVGRK